MKLGITLSTDKQETNWNAFRLANLTLSKGDAVSIFLVSEGVEYQQSCSPKFNIKEQVEEFLSSDKVKILACGTCLAIRNQESNEECPEGRMEDWYRLIAENDKTLKKLFLTTTILITLLLTPSTTFAQGRMGNWTSSPSSVTSDDHTAREEAEGKEVWEKLQAKQLECKNLTDEQYSSLGEYFMGQSIGDTQRHALMNQMMTNMMGEEGEEQMHVAMGKRVSGCEPNAQIPSNKVGFRPMLWMMGGGGNPMMGTGWENMMGGWNGFGLSGWISMLFFWILLILGVVALFRYLADSAKGDGREKSHLDILKGRYARGELDKKEFEQMKKDLA